MAISKIELVISGLDGTLLTSDNELSPDAKRVAVDLYYSGIRLCLVSSRPPRSILTYTRELGIRTPFAAFGGALLMLPDGQVLASQSLPANLAQRLLSLGTHLGLTVWLYDEKDWYAATRTPFVDREAQAVGFLPRVEKFAEYVKQPMIKLTVVGTADVVAQAESRVRSDLSRVCSITRPNPRYLDLTAAGWDKHNILQRFSQLYNVPPERIAVIGDGPEDIPLFTQAGLSIAMGNAVDDVRTYAQYTTTSNEQDGWARAISKYVLQKG